jgi:hypothetical protein
MYKRTVARIGPHLPLWFRVERKNSVVMDGRISNYLVTKSVAQSERKNTTLSTMRLFWDRTVPSP